MDNLINKDFNEAQDQPSLLGAVRCSALVTPDNYFGVEEWYIPVIECPKCKHKMPAKHTNYCSGCGVKLKLSITVQNWADKA